MVRGGGALWYNAPMATFKTILVATDFSDNAAAALETARRLADDLGASLRVAFVGSSSAVRDAVKAGLLAAGDDDAALERKVRELRERRMDEFLAPLGDAAAAVERTYLVGDAAREIVANARETGVDLVVVGRRGVTLGDVVLGGVAERVVRHAPCPVLIVRRS
jgi:universal stress protein A